MSTQRMNNQVETLEAGDIFLLDWPEAEEAKVEASADADRAERFYMLMHPSGWCNHRLIHIIKKSHAKHESLSDPQKDRPTDSGSTPGHKNFSGWVDEIVRGNRQLADYMATAEQGMKTYCHPPLTVMRLVAMGEYQLVRDGNNTCLTYQVAPPQHSHTVEREFDLGSSASYIIGVKNLPATCAKQANAMQSQSAAINGSQEADSGQGFLKADPPELLNEEGAEILLIPTDEAE